MKKIFRNFNDNNTILPTSITKDNLRFQTEKFFLFIPKQIKAVYHKLEVSVVGGLPNEIESAGDVFFIEINEKDKQKKLHAKQKSSHTDIAVDAEVFPYEVFFDPAKITDFHDLENNILEFDIKVFGAYNKNDQLTERLSEKIQLEFVKVFPEPEITFEFTEDFTKEFEHRKESKIQIGVLKIKNTSKVFYSYPLNCIIHVAGDETIPNDSFFYGEKYEIIETKPTTSGSSGLRTGDQQATSSLEKKKESYNKYSINNILPNNEVEVPVYANFDKIPNPVLALNSHKITFSSKYKFNGNEIVKSLSESIAIKQDTRTTALMSLLIQPGKKENFDRNINLQNRFQWKPGLDATKGCFTVRLGNYAENINSSKKGVVVIKDLSFSFMKDEVSPSEIITKDNISLADIFANNKTDYSNLTFQDGENAYQDFSFSFRHDIIDDIPDDLLNLICKVEFKYKVEAQTETNTDDNIPVNLDFDDDCESFMREIRFTIEKNPGPNWLAIDFGTSAYVSAHNAVEGFNQSFELLNLQNSFKETVRKHREEGISRYVKEEIDEFGTKFLSSSLMLMDGGKSFDDSQPNELIRLSPINRFINPFRIIPYIKSLIGTKELPDPTKKLNDFKYRENGNAVNFVDKPLLTSDLLVSVYKQVIDNFTIPEILNNDFKEDLNKLVLSYPNNFTPKHISLIKDIISNNFPQFKPQYTTFISESDAIASYYLDNWAQLNINRPEEDKNSFTPGEEYVLVYDMGAGTLDITYFLIRTDNNLSKKVEIIGKIGNTLAGNYFDFILAAVIVDLYKESLVDNLLNPSSRVEIMNGRDFKLFVKHILKPSLYTSNSDIECEYSNPMFKSFLQTDASFTLKIEDIRNHEFVKNYIYSNSTEIFTNLFSLFSKEIQGFVKIDTVLFSGRGVQLKGLKEEVISVLEHDYLAKTRPYIVELENNTLKSAVVEGALRFASVYNQSGSSIRFVNKNLMARYGILYRDKTGNYAFKELLNPTTEPSKQDPTEVHGMRIFEYDTNVYCAEDTNDQRAPRPLEIDLSATNKAFLIQTYSLDPASDMEKGKSELITTISSFDASLEEDKSHVEVRLQITRTNSLLVSYGSTDLDPKDSLMIDMKNDKQFKHSLWPYL